MRPARYPCVYVIQGMAGMADAWFNVEPWTRSYPDLIDALAPDAIVVLVDAFTKLGGSQYLDSPGIGNYHTLPLRRDRPLRRRPLPDARSPGAPWHPGKVVRRLRLDDHPAPPS